MAKKGGGAGSKRKKKKARSDGVSTFLHASHVVSKTRDLCCSEALT